MSVMPCQNGGSCINRPGSYECYCRPGYYGQHCESGMLQIIFCFFVIQLHKFCSCITAQDQ